MKYLVTGATALLTSVSVPAQFASPAGAVAGRDAGNSSVASTQPFSAGPAGRRFQYILGDLASGAQVIRRLRLQADATAYAGRTVKILLGLGHAPPGTACQPSTTYAANYRGAPVVVLDNGSGGSTPVNLPASTGAFDSIPIPFNSGATFLYIGVDELIVDFVTDNATSAGSYGLDVETGTCVPSVGSSIYNGLHGCTVPPNTSQFDIFKGGPTAVGNSTACTQYAMRGPANSFGILSLGAIDPNSAFGGLLCAPLRALPDIYAGLFLTSDAVGNVASASAPVSLTFPHLLAPFTFYTQFIMVDPNRAAPEFSVSLSDGIRWNITAPALRPRRMIYDTTSSTAPSGASSQAVPPVFFFN
jgi:hypothetical protein